MNKINKSVLRRMDGLVQLPPSEPQIERVAKLRPIADPANVTLISEVFGSAILDSQEKVLAIIKAQNEISAEAERLLKAAVSMGRSLLDVKRILSPMEFARGMRESSRIWRGLSRGNAQKLMTVAQWWDNGKLPVERCPHYYTIVYEFTTLGDDGFAQAVEENVFRPDVTRSEVLVWKRSYKGRDRISSEQTGVDEFLRLKVRRSELLGELIELRQKMREISSKISPKIPGDFSD